MKYTIEGLNQEVLLRRGLDAEDAVILRWFIDFWPMMNKKDGPGGVQCGWVAYSHLLRDLPVLGMSNLKVVGRRFQRYVESGLMVGLCDRADNSKTYYGLIPARWAELVESRALESAEAGHSKVPRPGTRKYHDPSSIDPSSTDLFAAPPVPPPVHVLKDGENPKKAAKGREAKKVTDYFQKLFMQDYNGAKPAWDGKIMKLVHADVGRLGAELVCELVWTFFEYPPAFVKERETGMGYNIFHSVIDSLLEKKRRHDGKREESRVHADAS